MKTKTAEQVKVGDQLAFDVGRGPDRRYEVYSVSRITPSGRIKCGHYELNPDLTVRGRSGYWGPYRAEVVDQAITDKVERQKMLEYLQGFNFQQLNTDQLRDVVNIVCSVKESR